MVPEELEEEIVYLYQNKDNTKAKNQIKLRKLYKIKLITKIAIAHSNYYFLYFPY